MTKPVLFISKIFPPCDFVCPSKELEQYTGIINALSILECWIMSFKLLADVKVQLLGDADGLDEVEDDASLLNDVIDRKYPKGPPPRV